MKSKKIVILEKILKFLATKAIRKYNPKVVTITGSVGKTSTKEAVFAVLSRKYRVRKNEKNYNNEIGVPLTILGLKGGGGNFFMWLKELIKATIFVFSPKLHDYPQFLVLELGADRPGDIKYLCQIVKPDVGIVTSVGISHLEFFKTQKAIFKEKSTLIANLRKDGLAVLNYDDELVREMGKSSRAKVIYYGFSVDAEMKASDLFFGYENSPNNSNKEPSQTIKGISFKLSYQGTTIPVRLINSVGRPQIYTALAAAACGIHFEMNLIEIAEALKEFKPPLGRLNIIEGIKNSTIIDDSYNSAPQSAKEALEVLRKIKAKRKIAILGDMLELGEETERGHREIGALAVKVADIIFFIGDKMAFGADEAIKKGFDGSRIWCYNSSDEAKFDIQKKIEPGDLVLIKGSQGMRLEKITEEIMKNPLEASKLLPRQTPEWKNK